MSRLSPKEEFISTEEILFNTNNGFDIYKNELKLERKGNNHLGLCPFHNERTPSFNIKNTGMYKCFGCGESGNVFTFIMKKYNLNFIEAKEYISKNLVLKPNFDIITFEKKKPKNTEIKYDFEPCEYSEKAKDYYCIEGITPEFLEKEMNIFNICKYAINKNVKLVPEDEIMFCYEYRDINNKPDGKVKLLKIGKNVSKLDKWRTNTNPTEFYYTYKLTQETKQCFIVKSNKDCIHLALIGITAIATMSENEINIEEGLKKLLPLYPNTKFILNLGSDIQGFNTSFNLSKKFNLKWFNIPKRFLSSGINDNFGFIKEYGLEAFKKLLKNKKYL